MVAGAGACIVKLPPDVWGSVLGLMMSGGMLMAKGPVGHMEPIHMVIRPINLAQHEVEVDIELPAEALAKGAVAALPVWTPGSYLVRDYARFVDRVTLKDSAGKLYRVEKLGKQRWQIPSLKGNAILSYRVFCNELSVRTNHVDANHAQLVGAASFMHLENEQQRSVEVCFEGFPKDWKVASSLRLKDGAYHASSYEELLDSPFELGTFRLHRFYALNADFEFAITGEHNGDEARIVEGAKKIVTQAGKIFDGFPFKHYTFLLTFSPKGGGGLEHKDSTLLLSDPFRFNKNAGYEGLFGLISHEFFHAWNVKRLHDPVLGPFDYSGENYTKLLWFHEGITDYMDNLIAMKAGVISWPTVAKEWGKRWAENGQRPGRVEQSLEEASFDAWIRFYKPTEFTPNSTVDYYEAGALVGLMMDAQIRVGSQGSKGMEDLFALLWQRHGENGLTDADIRKAYRELSGLDPEPFWDAHIRHSGPLESAAIEAAYGLKFEAKAPWESLPPEDSKDATLTRYARSYVGLEFGTAPDAPTIKNVIPGSPAFESGLSYGQEIMAVNGWRTTSGTEVQQRIADVPVNAKVEFTVVDRGRVKSVSVPVIDNPIRTFRILPDPLATAEQKAVFTKWTGLPFPSPSPLSLKSRSGQL
jgi:predicted metalloprotease with PDZ domain